MQPQGTRACTQGLMLLHRQELTSESEDVLRNRLKKLLLLLSRPRSWSVLVRLPLWIM